ncbi:hypothetical protein BDAG_01079 [Burkholderia dolosa AU0158]|nr:hypothetical protein BDAG_01079 [Burkholderia dolosa AU0158]
MGAHRPNQRRKDDHRHDVARARDVGRVAARPGADALNAASAARRTPRYNPVTRRWRVARSGLARSFTKPLFALHSSQP